jgi:hypothetical protein
VTDEIGAALAQKPARLRADRAITVQKHTKLGVMNVVETPRQLIQNMAALSAGYDTNLVISALVTVFADILEHVPEMREDFEKKLVIK